MTTCAFHLVLSLMFELFGHFFGDHFSLLFFLLQSEELRV